MAKKRFNKVVFEETRPIKASVSKIDYRQVLRDNGFKIAKDGKITRTSEPSEYQPRAKARIKTYTKESALNKIARESHFKDYASYLKFRKTSVYKQMEERARKLGVRYNLGSDFLKELKRWKDVRYGKKTAQLRDLLKTLKWIDRFNYARYA